MEGWVPSRSISDYKQRQQQPEQRPDGRELGNVQKNDRWWVCSLRLTCRGEMKKIRLKREVGSNGGFLWMPVSSESFLYKGECLDYSGRAVIMGFGEVILKGKNGGQKQVGYFQIWGEGMWDQSIVVAVDRGRKSKKRFKGRLNKIWLGQRGRERLK